MQSLRQFGREVLPPAVRFELRRAALGLGIQLDRARLWNWQRVRLVPEGAAPFAVEYLGRRDQRWQVCTILGLREEPAAHVPHVADHAHTAVVSELPLRGGLRVPFHLDAVVPLGRSVDEILAGYHRELRRALHQYERRARTRQVVDDQEIERLQHEMLEPFGTARHGAHAFNMSLGDIRRIAQETGRLDILYLDDQEVGCHLGYPFVHRGRSYWESVRAGYLEAIFNDPRRYAIAQSTNVHLALCWAAEHGFDYYNMGMTPARPDHGIMQYKRRRGARLTPEFADGFFWVRLPARQRATFLWEAPLFSVERGDLILHLGVPNGPGDAEAAHRYRGMGFDGLSRVELHCARKPGAELLHALGQLYAPHDQPPDVVEVAK